MGFIVFLVGVRGAGKTTLLENLKAKPNCIILKPSTTRKPRTTSDTEYHFTDDWIPKDYAWEISVGQYKYGMLKSELTRVKNDLFAITVFDPKSFYILNEFRNRTSLDVLTIGLDTISDSEKQHQRVNYDESRLLKKKEFIKQRETVRNCDVLLNGDEDEIPDATLAVFECLISRGGIVQKSIITRLLAANVLLENTTRKVEPASYDLRLGDDVWCQGKFIKLDEKNPVLTIPAYSYAIVSSKELASLPSFISARFDLKNSLFFKGIILSNGPQIDPGYRGALFCMLYNGSDRDIGIARENAFSTIEFVTTAGVDIGYRDKYQGKTKLKDFMPSDAAVSKGGQILERTEKKIDAIQEEWKNFRNIMLTLLALIVGPSFLVYFNVWQKLENTKDQYEKRLESIDVLESQLLELEKNHQIKLKTIKSQYIEKLKSIDNLENRLLELRKNTK